MPGLPEEDAIRLVEGRPKLLELKLSVLEEVANWLRSNGAGNLFSSCLPILTANLSADEAEFLLKCDLYFTGLDVRTRVEGADRRFGISPGGLSDLLLLIGHLQRERQLAKEGVTGRDILAIPQSAKNLAGDDKERDFWRSFCGQVDRALAEDFCEDFVVSVPRTHKQEFEELFQACVRVREAQRQGLVPEGILPPFRRQPTKPGNRRSPKRNAPRRSSSHGSRTLARFIKTILVKDPGKAFPGKFLADEAVKVGIELSVHFDGRNTPVAKAIALLREDGLRIPRGRYMLPKVDAPKK